MKNLGLLSWLSKKKLTDEQVANIFVNTSFETVERGWPQVAEGLALLMQRNPRAHVLLVGSDEVAYGAKRSDGLSWREWALKEWPMDPSRLHQLPALGYEKYKRVIQRSWVHVYWTVPFILSWSLMESLASGCCVVASATPPVQEMIQSGKEGQLVDGSKIISKLGSNGRLYFEIRKDGKPINPVAYIK